MKKKAKTPAEPRPFEGFKVTTTRAKLRGDLALLKRSANAKSTIPILGHVLLTAVDGDLVLHTTDLDHWIFIDHGYSELSGEGSLALPLATLNKVLSVIDSEVLDLVQETPQDLSLWADATKINFSGMPAEDFPSAPKIEVLAVSSGNSKPRNRVPPTEIDFRASELEAAVRSILFCVSTEESRFQMNGAQIEFGEGCFWISATDSHRLAARKYPLEEGALRGETRSLLIPRAALEDLLALNSKPSQVLTLRVGTDHAEVLAGGVRLLFRLLEGTFPDWRRVILREPKVVVSAPVSALSTVCNLAIKCDLDVLRMEVNGELRAGGHSGDGIEINRVIPIIDKDGDLDGRVVRIGVNPRYLLDAMKHCQSKVVELRIVDQDCQMGVSAPGSFEEYPQIIMPMRV